MSENVYVTFCFSRLIISQASGMFPNDSDKKSDYSDSDDEEDCNKSNYYFYFVIIHVITLNC